MTNLTKNRGGARKPVSLFLHTRQSAMFDVEPYDRHHPQTLAKAGDNRRLKGFLKRAVEKDFAPESLIHAIKIGIRR
ncbi:MAG: hypothetical protein ABI999_00770 [Acidobacteriota bacterium]